MEFQLNVIVSNNPPTSFSPAQQMLLRLLSLGEGGDTSQHSPVVSKINECKSRCEAFNKDLLSFIKRTKDGLNEIVKEVDNFSDEDPNIQILVNDLVKTHSNISSALLTIEPMIKSQLESITKLSDHVRPPTEELFRKKALNYISKNPVQKLPQSKKNTCTICLENTADIIIKRNCTDKKPKDNSNVNNNNPVSVNNGHNNSSSGNNNNHSSIPTIPTAINSNSSTNSNTTSTTNSASNTTTQTNPTTSRRLRNIGMLFPFSTTEARAERENQRKTTFCENSICRCGTTMCKECLIKHYWVSSSNGLKSFSTCVCCRAEFCLKDLHTVEYEEEEEEELEEIEAIKISDGNSPTTTTTTTTTTTSPILNPSKRRQESTDESSSNKRLRSRDTNESKKPTNKKKSVNNEASIVRGIGEQKKKDLNSKTIVVENSDTENNKQDSDTQSQNSSDEEDDGSNENRSTRVSPFNTFKKFITFWK